MSRLFRPCYMAPDTVAGMSQYPGERLGLPRDGAGAVAGYGRRLLALAADWLIAMLAAAVLAAAYGWGAQPRSLATLVIFGAIVWVPTALFGTTAGKRLCGLRVVRTGGGSAGPLWALVRTALLLVVVPALLWDRDYRGLHDRAADTIVVRA
jgi:uncharacterized RDD family membrane protein YckC